MLDRTEGDDQVEGVIQSYELAFRMQSAVPEAMDLTSEPESVRSAYGLDEDASRNFGTQCLLARRMAEKGVRFIEIGHRSWDQHNNLRQRLKANADAIDKPIAALIADLKQRGMLDETLIVWAGNSAAQRMSKRQERWPAPQQSRFHDVDGWRRDQGRNPLRTLRRARRGGREPGSHPRFACDDPAPAWPRPREADLPLRGPRLPLDGRSRPRGQGDSGVGWIPARDRFPGVRVPSPSRCCARISKGKGP